MASSSSSFLKLPNELNRKRQINKIIERLFNGQHIKKVQSVFLFSFRSNDFLFLKFYKSMNLRCPCDLLPFNTPWLFITNPKIHVRLPRWTNLFSWKLEICVPWSNKSISIEEILKPISVGYKRFARSVVSSRKSKPRTWPLSLKHFQISKKKGPVKSINERQH